MSRLNVEIDEQLYKKFQLKVLTDNTDISEKVRSWVETYVLNKEPALRPNKKDLIEVHPSSNVRKPKTIPTYPMNNDNKRVTDEVKQTVEDRLNGFILGG